MVIFITDCNPGKINQFTKFKDVTIAFSTLFSQLQKQLKNCNDFMIIKNTCVAFAGKKLSEAITNTQDINGLFKLFADNKEHCNWLNVRFLEVIATASGDDQLTKLVENYKIAIDSKTLREVLNGFPYHHKVETECYSELKIKFDGQDPDNVTVEKLKKECEPYLIKNIAFLIAVIEEDSLRITWLIPTDTVYQTYLSALMMPEKSRLDSYLQIGDWVVHHPLLVLQNLHKKHC